MTEAAKPKTEAASENTVHPAPTIAPGPQPDPGRAEVKPCGCEDRVTSLEGRAAAYETFNRAMSWLMIALAAGVIYILWTAGDDKASSKKADSG